MEKDQVLYSVYSSTVLYVSHSYHMIEYCCMQRHNILYITFNIHLLTSYSTWVKLLITARFENLCINHLLSCIYTQSLLCRAPA
jgi:hypothetical protein